MAVTERKALHASLLGGNKEKQSKTAQKPGAKDTHDHGTSKGTWRPWDEGAETVYGSEQNKLYACAVGTYCYHALRKCVIS